MRNNSFDAQKLNQVAAKIEKRENSLDIFRAKRVENELEKEPSFHDAKRKSSNKMSIETNKIVVDQAPKSSIGQLILNSTNLPVNSSNSASNANKKMLKQNPGGTQIAQELSDLVVYTQAVKLRGKIGL